MENVAMVTSGPHSMAVNGMVFLATNVRPEKPMKMEYAVEGAEPNLILLAVQ